MVRVAGEVRRTTVSRLEQLRGCGELTGGHVDLAARALGVTARTVWRWLGDCPGPGRAGADGFRLSETDVEAYAFYRGNVSALARAREAVLEGDGTTAGAPVPEFLAEGWSDAASVTRRTLARAFEREMTPAERAAWKVGEEGRRAKNVYLRRPDAGRGQVWEMDHKQLPLLVLPPKGRPIMPWLTTVVDDGTRGLLGWALAVYPSSATVLTAMRMALVHEEGRSPFGAVPSRVRIDRGLEFAASAIEQVIGALCVTVHRLPAYMPFRKGKVERLNLTIEQTLIAQLPGFTGGPRDAAGRLYGPVGDSARDKAQAEEAGAGPMRIERLAERFAAWADWYNTQRAHRMLGGRTPTTAWLEDPGPVHRIDAERLRHLLLADTTRVVGKDGIRFNGLTYLAPEIQGRVGQSVEVRYMPHDDRQIEVYLGGAHLCTAYPSGQLTDEQADHWRTQQREEAERLGRERRAASRRARTVLAPMTGPGTPVPSKLVPRTAAAGHAGRSLDAALRAKASSSLLGLTPTLPAPEPTEIED
ncbi:Mu transposase C-terminal domain-containing protein [Kitasatospora sp. NPDC096128]|uniref:Mu transposase C-terminal domain-containing protein n=1 Tax=Kitasatospora sp. NPDC096128 TaxID=3155547 RepID=UPI00332024C4